MKARVLSLLIHGIVIGILAVVSSQSPKRTRVPGFALLVDRNRTPLIAPYLRRGGGGGGGRAALPAPRGALPKRADRQFVPPSAVPLEFKPVLLMEATLIAPAESQHSNPVLTRIGDPFGRDGPPSDGRGRKGGIGDGSDGGIGNHRGPGFGRDDDGGVALNGRIGGGVAAPVVLYKEDPEFSEEARKAKYQGTVVLTIEVGEDGKPHAFRVIRGLGLGLDEKAIEAVSRWKFRPAMRNGRPVRAPATIEVNFRLL